MPDITITITPAAALTRAVDALCALNNYQATIDGSPNPETRNQFGKRMLAQWVKSEVARYETGIAIEAARATAQASAAQLDIT